MESKSFLNALDLNQSYWFEASAGTGKTYTLVQLVLRFLLGLQMEKPVSMDRFLLLSFTEKSTLDIKVRVRQKIRQLLENPSEQKLFLEETGNKISQEFLVSQLKESLKNFDSATFTTIHGFASKTIQEYPEIFSLPSPIQIHSDNSHLDKLVKDVLETEIQEYFGDNLPYLFQVIQFRTESVFARKSVTDILSQGILNPEYFKESNVDFEQILSILDSIEEILTSLKEPTVSKGNSLLKNIFPNFQKLQKNLKEDRKGNVLFEITSYMQLLLDQERTVAKEKVTGKQAWKTYESDLLKQETTEMLPSSVLESLEELMVRFLNSSNEWFYSKLISILLQRIEKEIYAFGRLRYDDLIQILHANKNNQFLQEKLNRDYQVVFIDEFQDTDREQFEFMDAIFIKPKKAKVFLLGDPKQSIYQFRGSDLDQYLLARKLFLATNPNAILKLQTSFRTSQELQKKLNTFFQSSGWFPMQSTLEKTLQIEYETVETPEQTKNKFVDAEESEKTILFLQEPEAPLSSNAPKYDLLLREIQKLILHPPKLQINGKIRDLEPSDIAILALKNSDLREIQFFLKQNEIPTRIYKEIGLLASQEANQISILLEFLSEPISETSYKKLLLSEFFGVTLEELEFYSKLPTDHKFRVLAFTWHEWFQRRELSKIVDSVFEESNLEKLDISKLADARKKMNYMQIFQKLLQASFETNANIEDIFLDFQSQKKERTDNILAMDSETSAVQLLTVHISKGLEFPILFIVLDDSLQKKEDETPVSIESKISSEKIIKEISYIQYQKATNSQKTIDETIRNLYVAFTRAMLRVYVLNLKPNPFVETIQKNSISYTPEKSQILSKIATSKEHIETHFLKNTFENRRFVIKSYSSIASQMKAKDEIHSETQKELKKDEEFSEEESEDILESSEMVGNFFHSILEEIQLSSIPNPDALNLLIGSLIDAEWKRYFQVSLNSEKRDRIFQILMASVSTKLPEIETSILEIPQTHKIPEMKFYFTSEGIFTGAIDLLFQSNGKYYLLDWKSDKLSTYSPIFLHSAMKSRNYFIQMKLYYEFLLNFIAFKFPNLSQSEAEQKIGGFYYIFLRGVDKSQNGIFFHKFSNTTELEDFIR